MSRSNPNERPINPAKKFFEFNGASGTFSYYDKDAVNPDPKKKGMNVLVPMPFLFFVLDQLTTITGFNEPQGSGIWSNEIKDLKTGILTVRTKSGVQATGIYDVIKGKVVGSDYCKSVYIAYQENGQFVIGNIKMSGSCLNAWIEYSKGKNVYEGAIGFRSCSDHTKGAVNYKQPIFEPVKCKDETNALMIELDKQLQEYLTAYFAVTPAAEVAAPVAEVAAPPVQTNVSFGQPGQQQNQQNNFQQQQSQPQQQFQQSRSDGNGHVHQQQPPLNNTQLNGMLDNQPVQQQQMSPQQQIMQPQLGGFDDLPF